MTDATKKKRTVKLQFHYLKGATYRELPCHGALGGVTAQGKIWMSLFSERGAIPRIVEFDVEAQEGSNNVEFNEAEAKPSHIDTRNGIIRQVEMSTYLDLDVAMRLHKWLELRIEELQNRGKVQETAAGGRKKE